VTKDGHRLNPAGTALPACAVARGGHVPA